MTTSEVRDRPIGELEEGAELTTRGRTITEADLTSFSSLTGDWHPQHSDAEWASRSRFSGRVAHGMLLLSYAVGLVEFDPERVDALRGLESAAFKRPVRIGDTIRVRSRVEEVRALDEDTALVRLAWRIVNQSGEVVARAAPIVMVRHAGAPPPRSNGASRPQPRSEVAGGEPQLEEVFL